MVLKKTKKETVVFLPDIRSALNVGSIFRTADAAGVAKIYLAGYTPAPIDQFGRVNRQIAKTALGAEKSLAWEKVTKTGGLLSGLKKAGFKLVAVEQAKKAIDYKKVKLGPKTALIFGNETEGLAKKVLDQCDLIAEIPMHGQKESLNVSVSVGIVLFRLLDK